MLNFFFLSFALSELLSHSGPRTAVSRNTVDSVSIKMGVTGNVHWSYYVLVEAFSRALFAFLPLF